MIQVETMLDVADNTGAKQAQCIRILGNGNRKSCGVGDMIVATVKKAIPHGNVKKSDVVRGVIVRTRHAIRRTDGSYVRFDRNAMVVIDGQRRQSEAALASSVRWRASCERRTS